MTTVSDTSLVERLRARLQRDRRGNFDPELSIKLGPGVYEEVQEAAETIERQARELVEVTADRDRTARNRDMWKGQCERQAAQLTELHAAEAQRDGAYEECKAIIEPWTSPSTMRQRAGEMTAQEVRTVQAILSSVLDAIRAARLKPDQEETPLTKPTSTQNI